MKKILTSVTGAAVLLCIYSSFLFVQAKGDFDMPVLEWEGKDTYYRTNWVRLPFSVTHACEKEYLVIRVYPEGHEDRILYAREIETTGEPGTVETVGSSWDTASSEAGNYVVEAYMEYESFSMKMSCDEHLKIPIRLVGYIWIHDESTDEWKFIDENGYSPDHEWVTIDGGLFYFEDNGIMHHGWMDLDGKKVYISLKGMLKGWAKIKGKWYYFDEDYAMATGWLSLGNKTYYLGEDGVMVTGEQVIDGKTYRFKKNGELE